MTRPIGVPVVTPSNTPDRIRTSIGFLTLRRVFRLARTASIEVALQIGFVEGQAGRTAVDDRADRRPMAFAERRDRECLSECIACHESSPTRVVDRRKSLSEAPRAVSALTPIKTTRPPSRTNTPCPPCCNSGQTNGRSRKRREQVVGAAADFADQHAVLGEPAPCARQNPSDDIEAILTARQAPVVGSCRYSAGIAARSRALTYGGFVTIRSKVDASSPSNTSARATDTRSPSRCSATFRAANAQRAVVDVRQHDLGIRKHMRARDADATGAGAEIEDPIAGKRARNHGAKSELDQFGDRRARNQHTRVDQIAATGKPRLTDEIRTSAMHDPALEHANEFASLCAPSRSRRESNRPRPRDAATCHSSAERFVPRVVGAVAEHELVRREEIRERRDAASQPCRAEQPPRARLSCARILLPAAARTSIRRCAIIAPMLGGMLRVLVVGLVVLVAAMFMMPRAPSPTSAATVLAEPRALLPRRASSTRTARASTSTRFAAASRCSTSASRSAPTSARSR